MNTTQEIDKIEIIQKLWEQIDYKTGFIKEVAKDRNKSAHTLHNHWFARFWLVPKKHQDRVIELLKNKIKEQ